ncbi:hypothetical protein LTR62_005736 [Meristemomyces frigidus]|uniref:Cytochrome b5 heme-binding domain-containing protein n=1 Tax=Meristemomyces frigidus TaxID=1508187 RepID=A0AAN7TDR2_9PEZI|nr:hypothetical protein LTR62_005736 [Meristemomyces frigidus]
MHNILLLVCSALPWLATTSATTNNLQLTEAELEQYDGTGPDKTIYLAINGTIFDVSASPAFYGPGGHYHHFTAKDASRAWVTECWDNPDQLTWRLDNLTAMFMPKYLDEQMQEAADGTSSIEGADALGGGAAGLAKMAQQVVSKFGRLSEEALQARRVSDGEEAEASMHAALAHWFDFFNNNGKYSVVGTLVLDEGKPAPPEICEAAMKKRPVRGGLLEGVMNAGAMPGMAGGGAAEAKKPDFVKAAKAAGEKVKEAVVGEGKDEL